MRAPQAEIQTFTISASEYKVWRGVAVPEGLRVGQFFHQYFKLEKLTDPFSKYDADKIYEANGDHAISLILSHIDWGQ